MSSEPERRVAELFGRVLAAGFPAEMILEAHRLVGEMSDEELAIAEAASRALSEQVMWEQRRRRRVAQRPRHPA